MKISIGFDQSLHRQGARTLLEGIQVILLCDIDIRPIIQRLNTDDEIEEIGMEFGRLIKNILDDLSRNILNMGGVWKSEVKAHQHTQELLRQKEKELLSDSVRAELRTVRLELETEKRQNSYLQSQIETLEQKLEDEKWYWEDVVQQKKEEVADLNRVIAHRYLNLQTVDDE